MRILGRFLCWLFFVLIMLPFNICDFVELYEGVDEFFPWVSGGRFASHNSWVWVDIAIIALFPLIFELEGMSYLIVAMLCEIAFIGIYIRIYQWVNKKRDEKENKK